jgi:hypothetical protein
MRLSGTGRNSRINTASAWVVARDDAKLVGFVNVLWDGLVHAWIQDTMVARAAHRGVGTFLVAVAVTGPRGCGM